jgi:hypothetical protein
VGRGTFLDGFKRKNILHHFTKENNSLFNWSK